MNYIRARIEELKCFLKETKPSYSRGLQLFINYSPAAIGTIKSLTEVKSEKKLNAAIQWLIEELEATEQPGDHAEPVAEPSQKSEIVKPEKKVVVSNRLENKLGKLRSEFIFTQRELSSQHQVLKDLKSDGQRLAHIQANIIPLDNKSMDLHERIQYISENGKDLPSKRQKKNKKSEGFTGEKELRRYMAMPSVIAKVRKRIADTEETWKNASSTKEKSRLSALLVKQKATLELYIQEYENLKRKK
jgi:hypothetical protein